ncbi:hypothetical protein B0H14DRAFT_3125866 [Mycena olivaceomarginata]|nr:hypothetical protein B0H14DRAFT_3125866 [Mycena olivaceomarginata]
MIMTEVAVTLPDSPSPPSDSTATSTHSGDIEKNAVIKFNPAELELPEKLGRSSFFRWLHYIAFSYYRKTFTLIFVANLTAFIVFVVTQDGHPLAPNVGSAASVNLMVALLFRQENFSRVPTVRHCGFVAVSPKSFIMEERTVERVSQRLSGTSCTPRKPPGTISRIQIDGPSLISHESYILVTMFIFILAAAHPVLRRRYHDYFEAVHRYSGWVALATFWMHSIFSANQYRVFESGPPSLGRYLISTPNFWTLCISTSCSILSWGRLRKHDVYPEVLSSHAIRLHFKYRDMPPFYGLKVSTKPVLEWHAFATIPDDDGSGPKGFSVVVSAAGDWTRDALRTRPRNYGSADTRCTLFKKIVVVATGSGIGPCLSLFYADVTPRRIFWSTPNPQVTYGEEIVQAVKKADPEAWIWDGRPDMVAITYQLVLEAQAEAVFVISNPKLTRRVVYGMESRGIAAYGAIFDS